jgi:hypothetical protein
VRTVVTARAARIDVDEIEITRTEKLLAVVLTVFFLIGGVWTYTKLDDVGRSEYRAPQTYFTAAERVAVAHADRARQDSTRVFIPAVQAPRHAPAHARCASADLA